MESDEKGEKGDQCSQTRLHLFRSGRRQHIWWASLYKAGLLVWYLCLPFPHYQSRFCSVLYATNKIEIIKVIIFRLTLPKNWGSSLKRVSQLTVIKQVFYTSSVNAAWVAKQKGLVVILKWWRKSVSFDFPVSDRLPNGTEYWIESRRLNLIILKLRSSASLKYSFNLDSFKLDTTLASLKHSCDDH